MTDILCGKKEIAEAFRIGKDKLDEWIEEGMPCLLIGKTHYAHVGEIWEWLKERYDKQENRLGKNGKAN